MTFSISNVRGKLVKISKTEKSRGSVTEKTIKAIFEFEEFFDFGSAKIKVTVEFDNEHDANGLAVNKPYFLTLNPEPDLNEYIREVAEP